LLKNSVRLVWAKALTNNQKLSSQFSFISKSIDEKTMRWLELQD
jgi:hypothetical protein